MKKQPLSYVQNLPEFVKLEFSDTGDTGNEIDLLTGSNFYWSLVTGNVKDKEKSSLVSTNMNASITSEAHVVLLLDNKAKTNESNLSKF